MAIVSSLMTTALVYVGGGYPAFIARDGRHYVAISVERYHYHELRPSDIAFFPLFPATIRLLSQYDVDPAFVAVAIANISFVMFICGLWQYCNRRFEDVYFSNLCAACAVVLPTTLFMRVAHSESLFLLISITILIWIESDRRPILVAMLVGLITLARPVGVAFVPCVLVYSFAKLQHVTLVYRVIHTFFVGVISIWGIACFAIYCGIEFGEPLAFAKTQKLWTMRPSFGLPDKMFALLCFEPVWAVYVKDSYYDWRYLARPWQSSVISLQFANPIFWTMTVSALLYCRKSLTKYELLLAVGLIGIPYYTRAYEMAFNSQGRFCAVVIPFYVASGCILRRMPTVVAMSILSASFVYLCVYSYLFAMTPIF